MYDGNGLTSARPPEAALERTSLTLLAKPGQVVVSGTVKDLVAGSGVEFDDLGVRALRGVPGEFRLYAVRT